MDKKCQVQRIEQHPKVDLNYTACISATLETNEHV